MKELMQKLNQGFTLVELMVVVAIIGILSAVAVPNFKKYQAKSKTSEAKLQLAAIYSAQVAHYSDYDTYGTCLKDMGFDPSEESSERYYTVGFNVADGGTAADASSRGAACDPGTATDGSHFFIAYKGVGGAAPPATVSTTTSISTNSFQAAADGTVSKDYVGSDEWSINEKKLIRHEQTGY